MNALVPHFEFRMLSLQYGRTCLCVLPIPKLLLVVEGENVFYLQPFRPRVNEPLFRATEMIFIVTLTTDKRAHLLTGGLFVHVVVLNALRGFERAHPFNKGRTGYA